MPMALLSLACLLVNMLMVVPAFELVSGMSVKKGGIAVVDDRFLMMRRKGCVRKK